MVWLAHDPVGAHGVILTLPRVQPGDAEALERWARDVRAAARLDHPNLARVVEVGVQDHWPFIAVDREQGVTLGEWVAAHPNTPAADVVAWMCQLLRGLAFAHEAGVAHLDAQLHSVLINERGVVCLMGLATAGPGASATPIVPPAVSNDNTKTIVRSPLQAQRAAAAHDLLACGVLLHHLLTGQPALDEADTALVIARMAPLGRGTVIFTGASGSLRGKPGFAHFAAAKAGLRMISQSMAREFGPQGLHVAHVLIDGGVNGDRLRRMAPGMVEQRGEDGLLDVDAIAETYWQLHKQPSTAWAQEIDLRPYKELF